MCLGLFGVSGGYICHLPPLPSQLLQMGKTANSPKIAIVCDWLYGGGAEKVVLELHRLYPDAPIYTSYCSDEWRERLGGTVRTGYLQWWLFAKARKLLPLLRQWWFRSLNLKQYDVVISCTGNGEAKFVRTRTDARHISYCFTPPHFYWRKYDEYLQTPGMGALDPIARVGLRLLVKPLRARDYRAAQRVDEFISISAHIQADIQRFYGRESVVIHPPVDVDRLNSTASTTEHPKKTKVIYWGRHVPYKRIDLIIAACNELSLPLTIVGSGPQTNSLKHIAGPTVTFAGFVPDEKLPELAADASVFVFPSEEDFGIAPVEAMALGLPVLAYGLGGARDYVVPGKTGELFDEQTVSAVTQALRAFKPRRYDSTEIVRAAQQFGTDRFQRKISAFVKDGQ
jgi:glycosyltransferase involved in cell wall biosynthesis